MADPRVRDPAPTAPPQPQRAVLVLDGETTQALACTRSLGRAGHPVLVASRRPAPLAGWSRFCRGRFRLAADDAAAFAAARDWAAARGAGVVLPLTERSCRLVNAQRDAWEAAGITPGCAPDALLLQAFDKRATLRAAATAGVRVPETRAPFSLEASRAAARELGYPLVVKPRFSHAWDGTRFLRDLGPAHVYDDAALEAAVLARRQGAAWPLLQRRLAGRARGVFALCDHGRPCAWFAHERLREVRPTGSGSSLRRAAPLDERLRAPAARLLAAMRWHGPAMVEFLDDGGAEPALIEVNGRFWGSLQLAIDAGVDFPRLWLELLRGGQAHAAGYTPGVTVRWLWGDVKRLLHILRGPPPGYRGPYPSRLDGLRELIARQPAGTRIESWRADDPWPFVGEFVGGFYELVLGGR